MYFLTASNLNLVDMGWASSMGITLVELKLKQKLLSLMNWSFRCIFWPSLTSTKWTWGFDTKYWIGLGASQHACGQKQPSILQKLEVRESFPTFVKWMVTRFYPPLQKLLNHSANMQKCRFCFLKKNSWKLKNQLILSQIRNVLVKSFPMRHLTPL